MLGSMEQPKGDWCGRAGEEQAELERSVEAYPWLDHLGTVDFTLKCREKPSQGFKTGGDVIQCALKNLLGCAWQIFWTKKAGGRLEAISFVLQGDDRVGLVWWQK